MRAVSLAVGALLLLAGCLGAPSDVAPSGDDGAKGPGNGSSNPPKGFVPGAVTEPPAGGNVTEPVDPGAQPAPSAHAVVAVVDTGINPYHAHFAPWTSAPAASRIPGFPADARPLGLSLGASYADAAAADAAAWGAVEERTLYTIPGTRIVGAISMGGLGTLTDASSSLILDDVGHGTWSASAVAQNAPHVDIVVVQVGAGTLADGIRWAAAQPWIDVVSVSWGTIANAPTPLFAPDTTDAMQAASDAGKLVVVAAGNEPSAAPTGLSGPTWVVSVGGSSPDGKGETWTAGKGVDVVSDFSPAVARHDHASETVERYGTSFATPTVAGALAEAWWIARSEGETVSAQQLRSAMNAVATYYGPLDYRPNTMEIPVVAPWVQMGWGYVDGSLSAAIEDVATGEAPAPAKPEAEAWMAAVMAARAAIWG